MRSKKAHVLAAVCAALVLFGAPAAAAPTAVAVGDTLEASVVAAEGGEKHQFPLDLETPYGVFGAFLLICLIVGTVFGIINAVRQLRGDRPQADGSWRWR
jgi:hypothetical protein